MNYTGLIVGVWLISNIQETCIPFLNNGSGKIPKRRNLLLIAHADIHYVVCFILQILGGGLYRFRLLTEFVRELCEVLRSDLGTVSTNSETVRVYGFVSACVITAAVDYDRITDTRADIGAVCPITLYIRQSDKKRVRATEGRELWGKPSPSPQLHFGYPLLLEAPPLKPSLVCCWQSWLDKSCGEHLNCFQQCANAEHYRHNRKDEQKIVIRATVETPIVSVIKSKIVCTMRSIAKKPKNTSPSAP